MLTGNTNICLQKGVAIETQAGKGIIRKCRQSQQRKTEPERGHELVGHLSEIYSRCCSFSKPRLHEYYSRSVTGKTCCLPSIWPVSHRQCQFTDLRIMPQDSTVRVSILFIQSVRHCCGVLSRRFALACLSVNVLVFNLMLIVVVPDELLSSEHRG